MVKSVPLGRRVSAVVALLAPLAVLAVMVAVLLTRPLTLALAVGCVLVGLGAAAYAVTRAGVRRTLAAVLAVLALGAAVVLIFDAAGGLLVLGLVVGLILLGAAATRHALGRDIKSLKSSPTPGTAVGPAIRPVLLMNPKSGGGKVERFNLVEEARRRAQEVEAPDQVDGRLERRLEHRVHDHLEPRVVAQALLNDRLHRHALHAQDLGHLGEHPGGVGHLEV